MSVFEALMIVCFGFAWPFSIYRSWKSRSTSGKSVVFLFVVVVGYFFGIVHKILNKPDYVILLYCLNAVMVSIDIALFYRNCLIEAKKS